jgi:hypothetical protein
MKNLLKVAVAVCAALAAMSTQVKAQAVELTGAGSSGYFIQAGEGANYSSGAINAPCVWSENTNSVSATDTSVSPKAVDTGSAWVAWTTGTGGTCTSPASTAEVYAYLSTDSVVGDRCLFNSSTCSITYPTTTPAPAGLILTGGVSNCGTTGECDLPSSIAAALNSATVNFAGSDIRPEDAEFAITRALTSCGTAVASGSTYLGLGYSNGNQIGSYNYNQDGTGQYFNVVKFSLPSTFYATIVGASPVVVAVNSSTSGSGLDGSSVTALTAQELADFLAGSYSYTGQASGNSTPSATGSAVTVYIREPLSGTYNTMEYNIPNTTNASDPTNPNLPNFELSQDVGVNNISGQQNCNGSVPTGLVSGSSPAAYDLNISTASGGARQREIGTSKELAAVLANANGQSMGYAFWSQQNFAGFTSTAAPNAKYLQLIPYGSTTAVDPLLTAGTTYTGTIPTTSAQLADVDLHTTEDGSYPDWSLLRIITTSTTAEALAEDLAKATDDFDTSVISFAVPSKMTVVRSHFIPVAGTGYPTSAANGDNSLGAGNTACTDSEAGGDVGGVPLLLTGSSTLNGFGSDNTYCKDNSVKTGQTGYRF